MADTSVRDQFLSKFSVVMAKNFDVKTTREVIPLLNAFLSDYEISARETQLVLYEDYIPKWLQEYFIYKVISGCKQNSMQDYAMHLNDFFECIKRPCHDVTESDVQNYLGYCLSVRKNGKTYVDHKRIIINDFFKWSVQKHYLEENPCQAIPVIHGSRTNRVPYTEDELAKIRNEVDNVRDKAVIETLYSTACRIEELCRLNISDVDFDTGFVHLFGKGDKARTSFMNSEMKHALKVYLKTRCDKNPALFVTQRRSSVTGEYERVTTHGMETVTRRLSAKIGVAMIQPHRFRRTHATVLANSGANISDIQKILGHSNPNTTAIYIYQDEDNVKMVHKKFIR